MKIRNTTTHYGAVSVLFHWLTSVLVAVLFPLGLVMVELDYYDSGYQTYPPLHKALGVILLTLTLLRMLWVFLLSKPPKPLPQAKLFKWLAKSVHYLLYLCLLTVLISGYLISTADGRGVDVFGWFSVPAMFDPFDNQADIAGEIHELAAWSLLLLISLHLAGALKHHLVDKDGTLRRIFGR